MPELFEWRRGGLNIALAFAGYAVREDGRVERTKRETTLAGARARANTLRSMPRGNPTMAAKFAELKQVGAADA